MIKRTISKLRGKVSSRKITSDKDKAKNPAGKISKSNKKSTWKKRAEKTVSADKAEAAKDASTSQVKTEAQKLSPQKKVMSGEKNITMMQAFEWYLPDDGEYWKNIKEEASDLAKNGINMVWLPPAYKGAGGEHSVGYDVYDTYDLGEFEQKGAVRTKYGTKKEYLSAVKALQKKGIYVLSDVVLDHMMGADETELVKAFEFAAGNRHSQISGEMEVNAWTRFTFPGRNGAHSKETWNYTNFCGTDWDDGNKRTGIFCFEGKKWNGETDTEFGNFDYLMGADLDVDDPDTVKKVTDWGKWYLDTTGSDGFRLDAVKHIGFDFYKKWMEEMRAHKKENFFIVGEYWTAELGKLLHYLDVNENRLSLFDVPLHFAFQRAATSDGNFDMGSILNGTIVKERPECAVTFVDNHDTQPGQALCSFVPEWFKRHAYAIILLQEKGVPCVFYGDYYGIPHDGIAPVNGLKTLCKIRERYAYGKQSSYFDDSNIVGFTREAGVAVLMTDSLGGSKRMYVSNEFSGKEFYNVLNPEMAPVVIDGEGCGMFWVNNGDVSVWVEKQAYIRIK